MRFNEQHGCARVDWLGVSDFTPTELLAEPVEDGKTEEAAGLLRECVTNGGENALASEVERRAKERGISQRTLRRAKARAGVQTVNRDGRWYYEFIPRPPG